MNFKSTINRGELSFGASLDEGEKQLARVWKPIALQGVVAVTFGIVLLVWPDVGLKAMVWVVGVAAIASGLTAGIAALSLPAGARPFRGWLTLHALAATAVGIAVLVWPDLSGKALLYLIAVWAIAVGVLQLGAALVAPFKASRRALLGLNGVILTAFGVLMFVKPGDGAVALLTLVAAFAIVYGVFELELARQLRRGSTELERRIHSIRPKPAAQG